ncbi:glycosyltransferase family 2 protein [Granulicella arctica]|uniref:glycosyltransferase family 2 protein n=1 Tax=Granulicella arctica TaxID=940613 RepID=UPI0021E0B4E8|nr:glycosyltransferase family 2 protein [Granulicella arctica]
MTQDARQTPGTLAVLFNPTEEHVDNLLLLKRLCNDVVAVDNSPLPDLKLHVLLESLGIDVVVNSNRGGIAGAFNKGMERLIEKQCTLLFTFDQDSVVPEDYFLKMIEASRKLGTPTFLLGPKIFDINVDRYIPLLVMNRFGVTLTQMTDEDRGLVPCSSMISSGSVMSAETYRVVGAFREDYFIDQVDTEYCFRAFRKDVPVYINTALVMKHEIGKRVDRKIGFFNFIQWNYIPLRQYYSARNCIHVSRLYGRSLPSALLINLITLGQFISVIVYENNKLRKLGAMSAGVIDGLLGRYGSIEACQPLVSALCTGRPRLKQA